MFEAAMIPPSDFLSARHAIMSVVSSVSADTAVRVEDEW